MEICIKLGAQRGRMCLTGHSWVKSHHCERWDLAAGCKDVDSRKDSQRGKSMQPRVTDALFKTDKKHSVTNRVIRRSRLVRRVNGWNTRRSFILVILAVETGRLASIQHIFSRTKCTRGPHAHADWWLAILVLNMEMWKLSGRFTSYQ